MKRFVKGILIIIGLVLIGGIGFKYFSAKLVKEAVEQNDSYVNISMVADGTYEGHSEMGPVIVDVRVTVSNGELESVVLLNHQNGLGQSANSIVDAMVKSNTQDVDAISGATVSSEIIINAVNNALQQGVREE
ncbi:MAG: FMN-binding protein [Lachnospiraceae bacterium]|nr:FMN-binding protein [Lachnospiraceae bacterium]